MSTSKQNLLAGNRGVLTIDNEKMKDFVYNIQDYKLPDVSLPAARMATPFVDIPYAGEKLEFGILEVSFLIDEDLKNWNSLLKWLTGLGFPVSHKEYQKKEIAYSDATLIIHSNHQNPVATAKFYDIFPTWLSGVDFSTQDSETKYRTGSVNFAVLRYEIEPTN